MKLYKLNLINYQKIQIATKNVNAESKEEEALADGKVVIRAKYHKLHKKLEKCRVELINLQRNQKLKK